MPVSWEKLIRNGYFRYRKPDKSIINLVSVFHKNKVKKILDLGCGAGRHTVFLVKKGFFVVGLDSSKSALQITGKKLKKMKLRNYVLVQHDMVKLPFNDEEFDAVIAFASIDKNYYSKIKKSTEEVRRILRHRGLFFATLASTKSENYLIKPGIFVEPMTLKYSRSSTLEHFFDEKSAKILFKEFKILKFREVTTKIKPIDRWIKAVGFDILAKK